MTEPPPGVDGSEFRRLMGRWATGVSVVTSSDAGRDVGLTVNAFLSISLDPPQLLVSLTDDTDSMPVIERSGRFAVNLLAHDQRALSERFARAVEPREKFEALPIERGWGGLPLLVGTLAAFECRVRQSIPSADHVLLIGDVVGLRPGRDVAPLLFYHSGYSELGPGDGLKLPSARP